ncbi:Glycerate dehydrogenase [uncultured Roseburia sp.]|uniref:D-2-hydroxyacid dehydrogenase n=1 Tax=Brotonthovivens ammoniilytica TaxID=2981725 RepID=A0ABT2TM13_9FIRM|nr:D-2-hydroxyacid dehydrogenase [Brotonthovivens ammoniilytica]MCU6763191.1 D-2-hydroxyacid dehydrogenase [Brotonthovivens ammoniilytica]SCJ06253.1 Glycerate dehydrogenase [uncultured Roseburia sp.]
MADVLVMYKESDLTPMVITKEHIRKIQACITGRVYWCGSEDEAIERGYDAEVLFLWGGSGPMPEQYCARSANLRWIQSFSAGVNPIMDGPISHLPVRLTNAKGIHGKTMALTTIGYMISFMRNSQELYRRQMKHIWDKKFDIQPLEAEGMTVGIIGAGAIGCEIAKLSKSLGMRVLGVKRTVTPLTYFDEVFSNEELDTVLAQSDFVIVVLPLTDETRHLFGREKFRIMKPTAVLINIARGPVVKEEDLIQALECGQIGGAALDTVEEEPLAKDSVLWDMENVIITPHCAADSRAYIDRAVHMFCENLRLYERGKPLINEINMKKRY